MITNLETKISNSTERAAAAADLVILCATDDAYVMPLATMLFSAGQHLRIGSRAAVFILDGGVSEENKIKLRESLVDFPLDLHWITFDSRIVKQFSVSHHISHTAYFRLLLSELLPASIGRVLYLDCDLLIRGDLQELWDLESGDAIVSAVPDIACPHIDAKMGMANFRKANPYLAAFRPVQNYQELGIDEQALYFNSGVMLIDVERWREHGISPQLIECLKQNEEYIWCWDQYALNVVLHDKWKSLPLNWNMGSHAFEYPNPNYSPVDREAFKAMLDDPKIIHFTTEWKPWHFGIPHPYRDEFYQTLDQTVWNGWRPEKPDFSFRNWMDRTIVETIKRGTIAYRKIASAWPLS